MRCDRLNLEWFYVEPSVRLLYLKLGDVPTRQSFDRRGITPSQPDQSASLDSVTGGTYFVRVFAASAPTGETFTLSAATASFSIDSVSPTSGSNAGQVTISISGTQFGADVLRRPGDGDRVCFGRRGRSAGRGDNEIDVGRRAFDKLERSQVSE